ncbi:MAG: pantoate--beta-alanine ligase [Bacteroidetes bacterium]|nr:MAG: pantoate--beta-alanine ligase [Bacteroidota bacterium]
MNTYILIKDIQKELQGYLDKNLSIGFVPTMGALHDGHLSLLRRSKQENDVTVCSIFVNPIQFTNQQDLTGYPRMIEQDSKLLTEEEIDILFAPEVDEMYPPGEESRMDLDFGRLDKVMEGKYRPGHFNGVAVVVRKFFDIIRPARAYFGKKDFQQLTVIRHMVEALQLPVEIVPCETVRESDGLAMSSRNLMLSISERQLASRIYDVLMFTKANAGSVPVKKLQVMAQKRLAETPEFRIDYFEIVDKQTLLPVGSWDCPEQILACTALYLGEIRLIDNMELFS